MSETTSINSTTNNANEQNDNSINNDKGIDMKYIEEIKEKFVEKIDKNKQLFDYTANLIACDADSEIASKVIDEFVRKNECRRNEELYLPKFDLLHHVNNQQEFDIRRVLKFRQDSLKCKRLKIQLEELRSIIKREYLSICVYMEELKKYETEEEVSEGESICSEIFLEEDESIIEKIEKELKINKIEVKYKHLDMTRKEVNCILGIIKTKKKNIRLLLTIQQEIIKVIKEGENMMHFIENNNKVMEEEEEETSEEE